MKLKKIASLALAGVMAVSMLAGCSTGNNSNSNSTPDQGETEVVPASAVVNLLNNKQTITNKVKINFTADAQLESDLKKAIEMAGSTNGVTYVGTVLNNYLAITGKQNVAGFKGFSYQKTAKTNTLNDMLKASNYYKPNTGMSAIGIYDGAYNNTAIKAESIKDGTSNTYMMLIAVEGAANVQSPEVAINSVLGNINSLLSQLDEDSFNGAAKPANKDYYAFSYTGTAGAVTGVSQNGAPVYYIALTITQTVSAETTPSV